MAEEDSFAISIDSGTVFGSVHLAALQKEGAELENILKQGKDEDPITLKEFECFLIEEAEQEKELKAQGEEFSFWDLVLEQWSKEE